MTDVQTLVSQCRKLGAEFIPQPNGTLKVWAPAPLPEPLREALRKHKAEVLALLRQSPSWPCPLCGGPVRLESFRDDEAPTQFWTCTHCATWGATRDGARFPTVWVSGTTMQ